MNKIVKSISSTELSSMFAAVVSCVAMILSGTVYGAAMQPFPDGARVAFFGDSITANGGAMLRIAAHYRDAFPNCHVRFYNCGISGGGLGAAEMYFAEILAVRKPTHVVLAFGVNDSGAMLIDESSTDALAETKRAEEAAAAFRRRYTAMVGRIRSLGAEVILRTTTPYNESGDGAIPPEKGRNAAYRRVTDEIRAVARDLGLPLIDDYARMSELLAGGESLFALDRVHPSDYGQWRMAETLLSAQGFKIAPYSPRAELATKYGLVEWDDLWQRIADVNSCEWICVRDETLSPEAKIAKVRVWLEGEGAKPDAGKYMVRIARGYLRDKLHKDALIAEVETLWDRAVAAKDTLAYAGFEEFKIDKSAMGDAYWKIWNTEEDAKIDADIEANRKTDGTFALPVSDGAEVEVEQIAHEFRFGANIFNFNQLGSKERNDRYKAMFGDGGLFNQATVPFYWREYEPSPGVVRSDGAYEDSERYWNSMTREEAKKDFRWRRPATGPIVEFCRERGVTTYGHVLIYGSPAGFPRWIWYHCCPPEERFAFREYGISQGRIPEGREWCAGWMEAFNILGQDGVAAKCPGFAANMREAFRCRVEGVAARFGEIVDSWECANESWQDWVASGHRCRTGKPLMYSDNYGIMPGDYQLDACLDAKKFMPAKAKLNINDNRMCPEYRDMVKDLIASGAKIDVVGCQMHVFNTNAIARLAEGDVDGLSCAGVQPWTPKSIREGLDLMSEVGRPLHVSEITIPAPGVDAKSRMIQAIATRNFYRACFSHRSVVGITWWNTVDGGGYAGEPEVSGLMTKDLERKPAYKALDELINREWKTESVVRAKDGKVSFRGFRGKYRLSWKCAECGTAHVRYVTLSDGVCEGADESGVNPFCRPAARSFRVDGKVVALSDDAQTFNLVRLYPEAVVKGRDGEKWAKIEFDITAPSDGEYSLEIHNDYYGRLSVNGGVEEVTDGPWKGFRRNAVALRKGANHIVFRTRSGMGGNWTVGFRMPRSSGAMFNKE